MKRVLCGHDWPYHVHLVGLGTSADAKSAAEAVYEDLVSQGLR